MDDRQTTGARPAVSVAEIWSFQIDPSLRASDLVGFSVEAIDGRIGKVDDGTEEMGRSHLVIDTGPWIFGKKVMLPAGVVERVDMDTETVFVTRSKAEIKDAPEFVAETSADEDYRDRLGGYYGGF